MPGRMLKTLHYIRALTVIIERYTVYETDCGTVSQMEKMDRTSDHALLQASKNPQTAADTLAELAKEENYLIRKNVAAHLNTSAGVLWLLVSDKDYTVTSTARG